MRILDALVALGPFLIPIIAILAAFTIAIVAMIHRHQERVEKIRRGVDPDGPWPRN